MVSFQLIFNIIWKVYSYKVPRKMFTVMLLQHLQKKTWTEQKWNEVITCKQNCTMIIN